jgi:hypothetical protein
MKEEIKLNCVKFKTFNGNEGYISIKIIADDTNDDLDKGNFKLIILVGEDPVVIIPNEFFLSIKEVIEGLITQPFQSIDKNENIPVKRLIKSLDSDIRIWAKKNYDTRFLNYKISFPLLKHLKKVGETKFQIIFQQEVLHRYAFSPLLVKKYLEHNGYLKLIGDFF